MFCGNCGTNNQDGTAFCENCGAPLDSDLQSAQPAQPVQATYTPPTYTPPTYAPAAQKKNWMPIIIGAAVAVVAIILVIVMLGGHDYGFEKPEDAVMNYMEGYCEGDYDKLIKSVHPDSTKEDAEENFEEIQQEFKDDGLTYSDPEMVGEVDLTATQISAVKKTFDSKYDLEVTDVKSFTVRITAKQGKEEGTGEMNMYTVKIDGKWFVYYGGE